MGKTQPSQGQQPAGYGQSASAYGNPQGGYGAAPAAYGQSAPPQGGYGAAPSAYGQSAPSAYGQSTPPAYGQSAPPAYGSQPGGANPYGPVSSGYGQPQSGYGAPPSSTGYATQSSMPGGYGAPPSSTGYATQSSMPGGYGAPPASSTGYATQNSTAGGYGAPPPSYGGYGAQGGYGGGQSQQYPPSYPAQGGAGFPPGTDPSVINMFQQADVDRSGSIDAYELGRLLSQGRPPFSPRTLRLMLHLFADNRNDTTRIGTVGFAKLWKEIQQWQKKFHEFDRDNSGSIEVSELHAALLSFNFNIPPAVLQMLVSKYDVTGGSRSIGYDNFVECGFIVKGLTEKFRDQDKNLSGNATFDYTSFMLLVIPFVAA